MSQMHCSEYQLELLAVFPGELTDLEHDQISQHLSECWPCKERFDAVSTFYADLETRLQEELSEKDKFYGAFLARVKCSIFPFPRNVWN